MDSSPLLKTLNAAKKVLGHSGVFRIKGKWVVSEVPPDDAGELATSGEILGDLTSDVITGKVTDDDVASLHSDLAELLSSRLFRS